MHGIGLEDSLQKWFDHKVPKTKVAPAFITDALNEDDPGILKSSGKIIFLGNIPSVEYFTQSKKGNSREMATLSFTNKRSTQQINILKEQAEWLLPMLSALKPDLQPHQTLQQIKAGYEKAGLENFEMFWNNKPMNTLYKSGLLSL